MKRFRLLIAALLLTASVSAQHRSGYVQRPEKYTPTVYLISTHDADTVYNSAYAAREMAALNRLSVENATQDYIDTHRAGFQQVMPPQFIFASRNNKFSFALGGTITLRTSYEFLGTTDNIDFVPHDIPVPGNYATDQKLTMDATTSRFYLKAIANTQALGRIIVFIDADFRGGARGSYTPRIRSAYASMNGFTIGRDVTTFCDLQAAPEMIDFYGPNAYNFRFATMLRYEVSFAHDCMQFGIAAEMPSINAVYGAHFATLPQRVPDFPLYLQFSWGPERRSHLRASAVLRDMYARNVRTGENTSLLGWGTQLSGHIFLSQWAQLYMNGIYGEGITPYIQDLAGSGLDFTPNPENPQSIQTMPMWAWQASARFRLSPLLSLTGGYSAVTVEKKNGAFADNEYSRGQYIFGNLSYSLTSRCKVGVEYLYGRRKNMDGGRNHANRAQFQIQYHF